MLKLQFVDKRQPSMWLVDDRFTIGRDKGNGLVINDEGISIFHAELRQENGKLFLWDCGSVNGTFLNGTRVSTKTEVNVGDVIRLHLVELEIIDPSKAHIELPKAVNREIEKAVLPQWQVKALTGTLSGRMFPIDGTRVVGRDAGCDIPVTGAHVSRRHAELSIRGGRLWVKDLGSSNGTFINGKRADEAELHNGDEIKFDAMTFRVVGPAEVEDNVDDADMTQFRPVVAAVAPQPVAPKPAPAPAPQPVVQAAPAPSPAAAPAPKPAPRPAAQPSPAPAAPQAAPAAKKSGAGIIVILAVIAAVAVAAVYFVK